MRILEKYYTDTKKTDYQGTYILMFQIKKFKFNWFTDFGEWFIYVYWDKTWMRFSSIGYSKSTGMDL